MKKTLGVALFALLFAFPVLASAVELGGGYAITPLQNWETKDFPGLKYKMVITQPVEGFAANLNIVDEPFSGSMDEYMKLSIKTVQQLFKAEVLSEVPFSASNADELKLRQIFYVFTNSSGMKVVVTASSLRTNAREYESKFDEMVGSLRVN